MSLTFLFFFGFLRKKFDAMSYTSSSILLVNSLKYHRARLTNIDIDEPYVYLQLIPESESIIAQIEQIISSNMKSNQVDVSYSIGDHVIVQYNEDNKYYRARIESYSETSRTYVVYFLDNGYRKENICIEYIYPYIDALSPFPPQAHRYTFDQANVQSWQAASRVDIENHMLNKMVNFKLIDENESIISDILTDEQLANIDGTRMKVMLESEVEQTKTFSVSISSIDNDCFYIQKSPEDCSAVCDMETMLQTSMKEHRKNETWLIDDLCIVVDDQNRFYRGQIISTNDKTYDVRSIDYGYMVEKRTDDQLYLLPDGHMLRRAPLAQRCRLYTIDNTHTSSSVKESIQQSQTTEFVTIRVEKDRDATCWLVTLIRDEHVSNAISRLDATDNNRFEV
jgi:hypothetical protein